jgi:hypothetical protein
MVVNCFAKRKQNTTSDDSEENQNKSGLTNTRQTENFVFVRLNVSLVEEGLLELSI